MRDFGHREFTHPVGVCCEGLAVPDGIFKSLGDNLLRDMNRIEFHPEELGRALSNIYTVST